MIYGIIILTMAVRSSRRDAKADALRAHGALHPRPQAVQAPLFASHDFFDPRDLVQVKYEMLRQVDVEGAPVARTADAFGVSRPTFYQTQAAFKQRGIAGLVPRKRGPHGAHKLDDAVMTITEQWAHDIRRTRHIGAFTRWKSTTPTARRWSGCCGT